MRQSFDVLVQRDREGYYVATVPALKGCHTQARSLDQLMSRVKEAIELCLEVQTESAEKLDFVGMQRVTVEV
jgi:predicted RNase H-like HicB family nuclease